MPFVIGVLGVDGPTQDKEDSKYWFRKGQESPEEMVEFKGNVGAVRTEHCWDMTVHNLTQKVRTAARKMVEAEHPYEAEQRPGAARNLGRKYYQELFPTILTPEEIELKTTGESNASYHYNGSAYIYGKIGKAFAESIVDMNKE